MAQATHLNEKQFGSLWRYDPDEDMADDLMQARSMVEERDTPLSWWPVKR